MNLLRELHAEGATISPLIIVHLWLIRTSLTAARDPH